MKSTKYTLVLVLWVVILGTSFGQNVEQEEVEEQYYATVFDQSDASIQEQLTAFTAFTVDTTEKKHDNDLYSNQEEQFHDALFDKMNASIKEQLIVFTAFTANTTEKKS